jgi:hypothetical protein
MLGRLERQVNRVEGFYTLSGKVQRLAVANPLLEAPLKTGHPLFKDGDQLFKIFIPDGSPIQSARVRAISLNSAGNNSRYGRGEGFMLAQ